PLGSCVRRLGSSRFLLIDTPCGCFTEYLHRTRKDEPLNTSSHRAVQEVFCPVDIDGLIVLLSDMTIIQRMRLSREMHNRFTSDGRFPRALWVTNISDDNFNRLEKG